MYNKNRQRILISSLYSSHHIDIDASMKELERLVEAVDGVVVGEVRQRRERADAKTYFGKGKMEEIKTMASHLEATLLVVNEELSGSHLANLQEALDLPVLDRTSLILDIFSQRSRTSLSRDQVELAQLQYRKTRLRGIGIYLSRQGGGIGTRGPGETKLEVDRRALDQRIAELKKSIKEAKNVLDNQRKRRLSEYTPRVALVGYTNSGKSSLANYFMEYSASKGASVPERDMLFTTLETYVRKIDLEQGRTFYLSDTVGFIEHLPHGLVEAFKATLEEVLFADFLLLLTDGSTMHSFEQMEVTRTVLEELGAHRIPSLNILTKSDLGKVVDIPGAVSISVRTGEGMAEFISLLKNRIFSDFSEDQFFFPFGREIFYTSLLREGTLITQEYTHTGIALTAFVHSSIREKYREFYCEDRS